LTVLPYGISTHLLQAIKNHCAPKDDLATMNSQADFEGQIREFSGLEHAHNFSSFEMWTHNITQLWNLLSPYNHTMQVPCSHYVHMLHQHLQAHIMAKTDKIVGCKLKDGLNISSEWAATTDILTFM
jgi:hypothetical protein